MAKQKYLLTVKEVYVQSYIVYADSIEAAKEASLEDAEIIEGSLDYSHTLDQPYEVRLYDEISNNTQGSVQLSR